MRKTKKEYLRYKKERLVLSDVLPFEVPLIFSNRHFYNLLTSRQVRLENDRVYWKKDGAATEAIMRLIFGGTKRVGADAPRVRSGVPTTFSSFEVDRSGLSTAPFTYKVKHKEDAYRDISICHPRNQIALVEFFDQNKDAILYYCSLSPYSIRKPVRVAKYRYFKDRVHLDSLSHGENIIEEYDKEYESLRSFFVYKEYDNVHKFYDSEKFLHCEKKFGKLLKLDIARCFDSIYTHSLPWALIGKEIVKTHRNKIDDQFGGRFDRLMQMMNRAETNGILIGPEFSRIFAELILQSIDRKVCNRLEADQLFHRDDYEIFRYVDDYFIFYERDSVRDRVIQSLRIELKEHKLHLNDAKRIDFVRPILTNLTRAKRAIVQLLEDSLQYELSEKPNVDVNAPKVYSVKFRITPTELSTAYKTVVAECEVEESALLNLTLSRIERRCKIIFRKHSSAVVSDGSARRFAESIQNLLGFIFFVYSAAPRVNTTIRLCRILHIVVDYFKASSISAESRDMIFQQIYGDIQLILRKQSSGEHIQVETLYLLHALSELGESFVLDEKTLARYFRIEIEGGHYKSAHPLNYFSLVVLLFYMKRTPQFRRLRQFVEAFILSKISTKHNRFDDAESLYLMLDMVACPYVAIDTKRRLLTEFEISDESLQDAVIKYRWFWFTKWTDFRFQTELDYKLGQEVY